MRLRVRITILAFIVTLLTDLARPVPVPTLDVTYLTEQSELIVVGKIESVRDVGATSINLPTKSITAHTILCQVNVDVVVKGVFAGRELSFTYIVPDEPLGYASVIAPSYQLVFLRKTKDGYSFSDVYYASLPAVPGVNMVAGGALANVTSQLGGVIQSDSVPSDRKQMALYALSTVHTPQSSNLLKAGLQQADSGLRLNAAGFLLQRNDLSGLKLAESALVHSEGNVPRHILHNVAYGIAEGVKDDSAVPSLVRLLQVQDVETRRAATSALRHIGSRPAIQPLVRALEDADVEVRFNAVAGLAEITGQMDWAPNMDLFQSDEHKFLQHWREWASANGVPK